MITAWDGTNKVAESSSAPEKMQLLQLTMQNCGHRQALFYTT
jgi:hypothetical protein